MILGTCHTFLGMVKIRECVDGRFWHARRLGPSLFWQSTCNCLIVSGYSRGGVSNSRYVNEELVPRNDGG